MHDDSLGVLVNSYELADEAEEPLFRDFVGQLAERHPFDQPFSGLDALDCLYDLWKEHRRHLPPTHQGKTHTLPEHAPFSITLGTTPLVVTDPPFMQGYLSGYQYYVTVCRHLPLVDAGIAAFIVGTMTDGRQASAWNAGVVVGWIVALLDQGEEEGETHRTTRLSSQ